MTLIFQTLTGIFRFTILFSSTTMFLGIWPLKVLGKFSEAARKLSLIFFLLDVVSMHLIMIPDKKSKREILREFFLGTTKVPRLLLYLKSKLIESLGALHSLE